MNSRNESIKTRKVHLAVVIDADIKAGERTCITGDVDTHDLQACWYLGGEKGAYGGQSHVCRLFPAKRPYLSSVLENNTKTGHRPLRLPECLEAERQANKEPS